MMYKVTMRCGHVGDGKYIPITYVVIAESKKEAIEKAIRIPRVKHDDPNALIHISSCSEKEAIVIRERNNDDPYLKGTYDNPVDINLIKDRIRMMPVQLKSAKPKERKRPSNLWNRYLLEEVQYAY